MSKKRSVTGPYSYDDDDDYVPTKAVKYSSLDEKLEPAKVKEHTLDSDEEDGTEDDAGCAGSEKAYDVLKDDDIEGQEDETVAYEGETTITPFNMKEEMEEGHFDGDGFYHFKKDSDQIKDAWLDDIDWIKVKHTEDAVNKYGSGDDSSDTDEAKLPDGSSSTRQQELEVYRPMLELLKPGETVTRALKRLGGGKKLTSAQKWKLKKQSKQAGNETAQATDAGDSMQRMLELTHLANKIVEAGNMDVYEETYEMIAVKLQPKKEAPAMDMFSQPMATNSSTATTADATKNSPVDEAVSAVEEVRWHLKWENKPDAEVHGPFPSSQMVKWQDSGYLDKGAYVRKVADKETVWYHTNRIDFEIYV